MYHRAVLRDLRLTMEGLGSRVDRVTESGRAVAEALSARFEDTTYFRQYRESDEVPLAVLAELGSQTCLCSIPGRPDHQLLLDALIVEPIANPRWEARRRTHVDSFGLFLEFQSQRRYYKPVGRGTLEKAAKFGPTALNEAFRSSFAEAEVDDHPAALRTVSSRLGQSAIG